MEEKILSYWEVIEVIEYCMKDDAAYKFLNSAFDLPKNSETRFTFNSKMITKFKMFNHAINEERDFHYQSCEVNYNRVEELIDSSKKDLALSMLNGYIKEAGLSEKFKDIHDNLPKLIVASFIYAADFYNNTNTADRKNIRNIYKSKKSLSKGEQTLIDNIKQLSDSLIEEAKRRKNPFMFTKLVLNREYLPVMGKCDDTVKELIYFLYDKKDLLIIGDGGVGKTSFLFHVIDKYKDDSSYIPFYFSLSELKAFGKNDNTYESHYFEDAINKKIKELKIQGLTFEKIISADKDNMPKLLFLLDGVNEISTDHKSYHRAKLLKEIEKYAAYDNIRVIATSRSFHTASSFLPDAKHIVATGIDTKLVLDCLKFEPNKPQNIDSSLYNILSVPLFLLMYISNLRNKELSQNSKGAILFEFFNSDNTNVYTEAQIQAMLAEIDMETPDFIAPLYDFVYPYIACQMLKNDEFTTSTDTIDNCIKESGELILNDLSTANTHYIKYANDIVSLSDYANEIKTAYNQKIILKELIVDRLSFLQFESNGIYSFIHQHIRDYFAAIMNMNAILLPSDKLTKPYFNAFNHGWTGEVINFMIDVFNYDDTFISLENILNKLTFFSQEENYSSAAISNLFNLLTTMYDNDLSTLEFNNVDFSACDFNSINFNNPLTGSSASFNSCKFSKDTFKSKYNIKHYFSFYTFYDSKPVLIECHEKSHTLTVSITDIISEYLFASYTYSLKDTHLYDCTIVEVVISDDYKHIAFVFRDDNSNLAYLAVGNLVVDNTMFCNRDILNYTFLADLYIVPYFRTNGDLIIATNMLQFKIYDSKSNTFRNDKIFDHTKIKGFDTIHVEDCAPKFAKINDAKYLMFYPVYIHGNNPPDTYYIVILDIDTCELNVSPEPLNINILDNFCCDEKHLYVYTRKDIYIFDLKTLELEQQLRISKYYPQEFSDFVFGDMCVQNGYLYYAISNYLFIINTSDISEVKPLDLTKDGLFFSDILACNDSYIIFKRSDGITGVILYRISQETLSAITESDCGFIQYAYTNDVFPIIYSGGQISVVSYKDLSLIDTYIMKNTRELSYAYDEINNLLVISLCPTKNPYDRTNIVFDVSSGIKKLFEINAVNVPVFVFDSINKLLYVNVNDTFYVYDTVNYNSEPLAKTDAPIIYTSAEFIDGKVRFIGQPGYKIDIHDFEDGDRVVCELTYQNGIIQQKIYSAPVVSIDLSSIEAIRPGDRLYMEIFIKDEYSHPFIDYPYMKVINADDYTKCENIPLTNMKRAYISSESQVSLYLPRINDSEEKNYSFADYEGCLAIYKYGQNDKTLTELYDALGGRFTHIKGDILISAYKDNSLFKYDLKKDKRIKSTEFIPNINIAKTHINNPQCTNEVLKILKENGADL